MWSHVRGKFGKTALYIVYLFGPGFRTLCNVVHILVYRDFFRPSEIGKEKRGEKYIDLGTKKEGESSLIWRKRKVIGSEEERK